MPIDAGGSAVENAFILCRRKSADIKQRCADFVAVSSTAVQSANSLLSIMHDLSAWRAEIQAAAAVPGFAAFVATYYAARPGYDYLAELGQLYVLIEDVLLAMRDALPTGANGAVAIELIGADWSRTFVQLSPADTAPIRTAMSAVDQHINLVA